MARNYHQQDASRQVESRKETNNRQSNPCFSSTKQGTTFLPWDHQVGGRFAKSVEMKSLRRGRRWEMEKFASRTSRRVMTSCTKTLHFKLNETVRFGQCVSVVSTLGRYKGFLKNFHLKKIMVNFAILDLKCSFRCKSHLCSFIFYLILIEGCYRLYEIRCLDDLLDEIPRDLL